MLWDISGLYGSGKTIYTVYLASLESKHYPETPIFSNFKLHLPNTELLNPEDLIKMRYPKALIIIDEAYVWLESRISSSLINRYMSYILFQSRKRGLNFVLTAQLSMTIDIRYRHMSELVIEAEKEDIGFNYTFIPRKGNITQLTLPIDYCENNLYDKYDTLEIIEPFGIEEVSNQISILSNPKKANKLIDEIVESAKDLSLITHTTVSDYLLQKEISQSLEPYVYARLKQRQQKHKKSSN